MKKVKKPYLIKGACFKDDRGELKYNNQFDASVVKRMYMIKNSEANPVRGWQGHQIEQRWFIAVNGRFEIFVIEPDNWTKPSPQLLAENFIIDVQTFDVLHIPPGYITAIKSLQKDSALLTMSDFLLGTVSDEYRFPINYFENIF